VKTLASGKVRELFELDDRRLALVTSDRISAYDVILPTPIPDKGRVLTGLTIHWLAATADIVPNHLLGWRRGELPRELASDDEVGRVMVVRRLRMLPVECVARGYLAGSGWRDYERTGAVCGHELPTGLRQAQRLPEPIFTPATKATDGHDENISREQASEIVGVDTLEELERITLALYERAATACRSAGIILADTKFEIGLDEDDRLVLADEVVTPDSSRFWPEQDWALDVSPPSYDKQFVRDWLDATGWDHSPPAPDLPEDVVRGTRDRYVTAYERISGRTLASYLKEASR
jgi:phosphoribosylaminoimidazole-succinocarboxamide synthase